MKLPKKLYILILVCVLSLYANAAIADDCYDKWSSAQDNILTAWDIELIGYDLEAVPPAPIDTFAKNDFETFWVKFADDYNFQLEHTASPLIIWPTVFDEEFGCNVQEARQYVKKTSTPENAIVSRPHFDPEWEPNIHKINDNEYGVVVLINGIMVNYNFKWASGWYLSQIVMEPL